MLGILGGTGLAAALPPQTLSKTIATRTEIDIRNASYSFLDGKLTEGLVSTLPDAPPPVIRMRRDRPFTARVTNTLDDYTTMHWHGLRLANAMDGVP